MFLEILKRNTSKSLTREGKTAIHEKKVTNDDETRSTYIVGSVYDAYDVRTTIYLLLL